MRLNLGCGRRPKKGWTNVDVQNFGQEIVSDLLDLPLDDEVADEAMAIHVIEHFDVWDSEVALNEWFRVLKPGGQLLVEFPDLRKVISKIRETDEAELYTPENLSWLYGALYGNYPLKDTWMTHRWTFDPQDIAGAMLNAGFRPVAILKEPNYHRVDRDAAVIGYKPGADSNGDSELRRS